MHALRRHLAWLLAALAAGLVALLFQQVEQVSEELRRSILAISPFLQAALLPLALVTVTQLRDRVFPGTDGTGIPQAIAALATPEGPARGRVLSGRIALGKMLLLTIGLLSGATIGREGPSVHVGACLLHLSSRFARFPRHLVERGLILAGGAAGIAAAFNAPIAGMIFVFEEIGRSFEKENAGMILRTTLVACLVPLLWLGDYVFYGRIDASLAHPVEWLAVPLAGVLGGLLGGAFAQGVISASRRLAPVYRRRPLLVAGGLGACLGVLGLLSGGLSYGSGFPHAEAILMEGREQPAWLFAAISAGSFLTLVSGIPGGLFDPSLSTGAALGQIAHGVFPWAEPRALVLLFMAGYFAAVVQSPITVFVILIEMTGSHALVLPLALTAAIAHAVSRLVCPVPLYEALAQSFLARIRAERDA